MGYPDVSGLAQKVATLNNNILYLVTEDWYFMSHRVSLAEAAIQAGFEITLLTQVSNHAETIRNLGINLIPISFPRALKRPWQDISTFIGIYKTYRKTKPDIIHNVSLKPSVYGSLMLFLGACSGEKPVVINAFTGLGYVFTSANISARIIRLILIPLLKLLFQQDNSYLLFQNEDDKRTLVNLGIGSEERSFLIPGSGVDVDKFTPHPESESVPVIMLVARMLYDKGIEDFVSAAQQVKEQGIEARFVLVGDIDEENPAGIKPKQLKTWHSEGIIEWWGKKDNMPEVYAESHIVVLPSHREGFPKTVIEASSCARPVITTDVPGCRDAIIANKTGLLIFPKDPSAMANAIVDLIKNKDRRIQMGKAGRKLVEEKLSTKVINLQFLDLYRNIQQ